MKNIPAGLQALANRVAGTKDLQSIKKALLQVDRAKFVPEAYIKNAYDDIPLPIGYGQTISQPSTVVFMLEKLSVKPGQKILEVGCGCGWVSALLAYMVGTGGKVIGMDIIPALVALAQSNSSNYTNSNLCFMNGDGNRGYEEESPYDRIIVSAGAKAIPQELLQQLIDGGRMVIPVGEFSQDIVVIDRRGGDFSQTRYPGFVFVPLVSKQH